MLREIKSLKGAMDLNAYADEFCYLMKIIPCYFNDPENIRRLENKIQTIKDDDDIIILWESIEHVLPILRHKANELNWAIKLIGKEVLGDRNDLRNESRENKVMRNA